LSAQSSHYAITLEGAPTFSYLKFKSSIFSIVDKPIWRYYGGMTLYYALGERYGIVSGVGYERKGGTSPMEMVNENGDFLGTGDYRIQLDYISVPMLFRKILGAKNAFFVDMGGSWGCLIKQEESLLFQNIYRVAHNNNLIINDFSVLLGVGMRFPLWKNWSLPITLRSQHSIFTLAPEPNPFKVNVRNNTAQLAIGLTYQFH
jgi:hypothetical protein